MATAYNTSYSKVGGAYGSYRSRPLSAPPRTASSMSSYKDPYTMKNNAAPDFQECVNEAVRNYMDSVMTHRATPNVYAAPQMIAPTAVDQMGIPQIAATALLPGMPVLATVVPTYPTTTADADLDHFIHTGIDVLKKSLPKDRIRSGLSKTSNLRPKLNKPPSTAQSNISIRPNVAKPPPASPLKTKDVSEPVANSSETVEIATDQLSAPLMCDNDTSQKHFTDRGSSPFNIKRPGTAKLKERELNENSKNKDENGFDWHWSVYKENEERSRTQTPKPPVGSRPPSPHKRPNTASVRRSSVRTPVATPIYNLHPAMIHPPSVQSSSPMRIVSKEPKKASPYGQALECWANGATDHEKSVVYNMMRRLNKNSGFTANRMERARSSLQSSRPASPVRMTKYTPAKNGQKVAGVKTSVPIYGSRPEVVELVPTNENALVTNYYQRLLDSIRAGNPVPSPYYCKKEVRPMNRHKPRPALQKEYTHQGSFFNNSQSPYRSNFTIHPDWVSERKTLHIVNQRN